MAFRASLTIVIGEDNKHKIRKLARFFFSGFALNSPLSPLVFT
jgi:hypothetical protein